MDCGYMMQADTTAADAGDQVIVCTNPACGVANPPGERNCVRCCNALPTPPAR